MSDEGWYGPCSGDCECDDANVSECDCNSIPSTLNAAVYYKSASSRPDGISTESWNHYRLATGTITGGPSTWTGTVQRPLRLQCSGSSPITITGDITSNPSFPLPIQSGSQAGLLKKCNRLYVHGCLPDQTSTPPPAPGYNDFSGDGVSFYIWERLKNVYQPDNTDSDCCDGVHNDGFNCVPMLLVSFSQGGTTISPEGGGIIGINQVTIDGGSTWPNDRKYFWRFDDIGDNLPDGFSLFPGLLAVEDLGGGQPQAAQGIIEIEGNSMTASIEQGFEGIEEDDDYKWNAGEDTWDLGAGWCSNLPITKTLTVTTYHNTAPGPPLTTNVDVDVTVSKVP